MTQEPSRRERGVWRAAAIGAVAFLAWLALLWAMFGDVL